MNPDNTSLFASLLPSHYHPTVDRGRKPTPFITEPNGDTRFHASRAAYIRRLHHFKVLTAVDHGCPCIDPIAETKRHIGSVRRTLWLYLYECLPDFPGKQAGLDSLQDTHNANILMQGIEKIIVERLLDGNVGDREFACRALDDVRLMKFAERWFDRKKGGRAI